MISEPSLGSGISHPESLRPYQVHGVRFLATNPFALLADQMGLGKTVQTITALRHLSLIHLCPRILVIVPASLRRNWIDELAKWAPEIASRSVLGDTEDRIATYSLPIPVLIATYDQIRNDSHRFHEIGKFDLVILDEAQRIKNKDSSLALACKVIPRARSWALTGTPMENKPQDLVSIFAFLHHGLLDKGMSMDEMQKAIQPHFLRRTKKSVLPELPPIISRDLVLELGPEQRQSYDDLWLSRNNNVQPGTQIRPIDMIALITALKLICNFDPVTQYSCKFDALELLVDETFSSGERLIVFSQYVSTLDWISSKLLDYPHHIYHGGLTEEERNAIVEDFQKDDGKPKLLLISLKAGGVGLNLGSADTVVLFDRWWNPAVENQAIERGHRFGRSSPLNVVKFIVKDTIEERIQNILITKQEMFDQYIKDSPATYYEPSAGDLRRMLAIANQNSTLQTT